MCYNTWNYDMFAEKLLGFLVIKGGVQCQVCFSLGLGVDKIRFYLMILIRVFFVQVYLVNKAKKHSRFPIRLYARSWIKHQPPFLLHSYVRPISSSSPFSISWEPVPLWFSPFANLPDWNNQGPCHSLSEPNAPVQTKGWLKSPLGQEWKPLLFAMISFRKSAFIQCQSSANKN